MFIQGLQFFSRTFKESQKKIDLFLFLLKYLDDNHNGKIVNKF